MEDKEQLSSLDLSLLTIFKGCKDVSSLRLLPLIPILSSLRTDSKCLFQNQPDLRNLDS